MMTFPQQEVSRCHNRIPNQSTEPRGETECDDFLGVQSKSKGLRHVLLTIGSRTRMSGWNRKDRAILYTLIFFFKKRKHRGICSPT